MDSGRPLPSHAPGVISQAASLELAALVAEDAEAAQSPFLQGKLQCGRENAETVNDAAPEVDRRRLFEILGRARDFADAVAEVDTLRQHLIVEDEVVGIFDQRQLGQDLTTEAAVAGVVLRELHPQEQVLKRGQQAVEDVLVARHAPTQRSTADDARSKYH